MFKIMAFLNKKQDLDTQAFIEYYEKHHAPFVLNHVASSSTSALPISYKRNFIVRGDSMNYNEGMRNIK